MFCKAFNKSLVIEPGKTLAVCCSDGTRMLNTSLKDITSLNDFFYNSEIYNSIRDQVKDLTSPKQFDPCLACHRVPEGFMGEMTVMNDIKFPERKGYDDSVDLKFLEVTTSNICKQSCVMCASKYSTTHAKIENQPEHISIMTDAEVQMIYDVLPNIHYLCLKGGEPFADHNNLKILKRLYEVNPNIKEIIIISNGQNISKAFKDILTKFSPEQVTMAFSLDAADEVYQWQRGSNYQSTVKTLNQLTDDTGITFCVLSTITAYTLPSLLKTYYRHSEDIKGLRHYVSTNIVWNPAHTSCALYTQSQIDDMVGPVLEDPGDIPSHGWNRMGLDKVQSFGDQKYVQQFKEHTEKWNNIRKLNIYDYVPELSLIS